MTAHGQVVRGRSLKYDPLAGRSSIDSMLHRLHQFLIMLTVFCMAVQSLGRGPMATLCLGCDSGPVSMTSERSSHDACCSGCGDPEPADRRSPLAPCDCPADCGCVDVMIGTDHAPSVAREQIAAPSAWPTLVIHFASIHVQMSVPDVVKGKPRFAIPPADRSPGLAPAVSSTAVLLI
jgi:hypothetical protein